MFKKQHTQLNPNLFFNQNMNRNQNFQNIFRYYLKNSPQNTSEKARKLFHLFWWMVLLRFEVDSFLVLVFLFTLKLVGTCWEFPWKDSPSLPSLSSFCWSKFSKQNTLMNIKFAMRANCSLSLIGAFDCRFGSEATGNNLSSVDFGNE